MKLRSVSVTTALTFLDVLAGSLGEFVYAYPVFYTTVLPLSYSSKVSALFAFKALLPSADYSALRSGRVWQPSADCNGHLAQLFFF